jgi:L-ascorbate metabolism protein UlaG (beta-lactamase superfamily)
MRKWFMLSLILLACSVRAQKDFTDTLSTSQGDLIIHVLGHASVLFEHNGMAVYIDPYTKVQDFTAMVKADLILITHVHDDHFDTLAIEKIIQPDTRMIYPQACADVHPYTGMDTIMANGDSVCISDLSIQAVPAYNITRTRHPKGIGNGYVIQFGNRRVYLSGDTEKIPEMENLTNIDLAFLPLSQPYNMTPEMMAETVVLIGPDILVPYHCDDADLTPLLDLLKDIPGLEVWTGESENPSGYRDFTLDSDLLIRPNPAEDLLFIEGSVTHATATIYDMAGRLVISCRPVKKGVLDIGSLQQGQYILQVVAKGRILTGIFLKN